MTDKDGIIFDPIAPRAGEKLVAKCTLVGLTPNDKRHVSRMNLSSFIHVDSSTTIGDFIFLFI
jgi:hypothetical protein